MPSAQVAPALKIQVHQKIAECISKIESHYNIKLHRPKVLFSRRGTIAAVANSANWLVDFNPVLLNENVDDFVAKTVPHEVAHLACDALYPDPANGGRRDVHGKRWQELMNLLGVHPERCHKYDVTNTKIHRKVTKYRYVCKCCKKAIDVGPRRHATLQANPDAFWHTACGKEAFLTFSGPVVTDPPSNPPVMKLPVENKMETCYNIFTRNPNRSRMDIIADFVGAVNCTDAAAATYLKVCQMWSVTLKQQT